MNILALIAMSIITLLVSIIGDINQLPESQGSWFQRSGSLLVIYGVIFEAKFILRSVDGSGKLPGGLAAIGGQEDKVPLLSLENIKKHLGFFTIILGTLIWGYGDLVV